MLSVNITAIRQMSRAGRKKIENCFVRRFFQEVLGKAGKVQVPRLDSRKEGEAAKKSKKRKEEAPESDSTGKAG